MSKLPVMNVAFANADGTHKTARVVAAHVAEAALAAAQERIEALEVALHQMRHAVRVDLDSNFNTTHPIVYAALKVADATLTLNQKDEQK